MRQRWPRASLDLSCCCPFDVTNLLLPICYANLLRQFWFDQPASITLQRLLFILLDQIKIVL